MIQPMSSAVKGTVPAPRPAMVPALGPVSPPPAQPSGPRPHAQMAQELAAAADTPENLELERKLAGAQAVAAQKDQEELTGKDLEFDIKTFLGFGSVRKENLKVMDGFYVDMQSLTQRDRIVAEQVVKAKFGNLSATDNVYTSALESAMLAMAITRVNNVSYPMPKMQEALADPKAYAAAFDKKVQLYETLLDSSEKLVGFLSVLYSRLEAADVLKEHKEGIDVGKKSDALSSPGSSGSSAAN